MEIKSKFKIGMRVFAMIKGFPYWPATVTKIDLSTKIPKYDVVFYGEKEIGVGIKENDVCLFSENKSRFNQLNKRNKKFTSAMKEAELSFNKSSTSRIQLVSPQSSSNSISDKNTFFNTTISAGEETPLAVSSPLQSPPSPNINQETF